MKSVSYNNAYYFIYKVLVILFWIVRLGKHIPMILDSTSIATFLSHVWSPSGRWHNDIICYYLLLDARYEQRENYCWNCISLFILHWWFLQPTVYIIDTLQIKYCHHVFWRLYLKVKMIGRKKYYFLFILNIVVL